MRKFHLFFLAMGVVCLSLFQTSCNKKDDDPTTETTSSGETVAGIVKNKNGQTLSGITVQCSGQTTTTGNFGEFVFENVTVTDSRIVVYCNDKNYFSATTSEIPSSTKTTQVTLTLMPKTTTATVASTAGGTAYLANGTEVDLPANSISKDGAAYTGNVNVAVAYLDPTSDDFGILTQGPDMRAQNESNETGTLYSYGVIRVELSDDSGNELNLASGQTASITVPIPAGLQSTAPATIPLWHFDETLGMWVEEGEAVKSGNEYVGTVSHFTDWNCDVWAPSQATVKGTVVDCHGEPLASAWVKIGQTYAYTNSNGEFSRRVPGGIAMSAQVTSAYNDGFTSDPVSIPALAGGEEYNTGNLQLTTCPAYVTGTLLGCGSQPINGWIKITTSDGVQYHVYTTDGTFKQRVPTNKALQASVLADNGGFKVVSLTTSADPNTENSFGNIEVCSSISLSENSFTIDGGSFSNENFSIQITTPIPNHNDYSDDYAYGNAGQDTAFYAQVRGPYDNNDSTFISSYFSVYTTGLTVGTPYSFGSTASASINIFTGNQMSSKYYYAQSGTLTITTLNEANSLAEGTYSGTFFMEGSSETVTITNGKFSVYLLPSTYYKKKK